MNPNCPHCQVGGECVVRHGRFFRASDSRYIPRFRCNACRRHFSRATFSPCYRQKKRLVNHRIELLLCSAVSLRRIARLVGVSRKTVSRKLAFLAEQARARQCRRLTSATEFTGRTEHLQFDDLETFEHTKCKPVTVTVAIMAPSRLILDFDVAPIPANGRLAAISRKKYGKRDDMSRMSREALFTRLVARVSGVATISSDKHAHYRSLVAGHFPQAKHFQYKGLRGIATGQGELKHAKYDPLFSINHTLAMLRANMSRLIRKTWCTTKRINCLEDHLAVYIDYHNRIVVEQLVSKRD